MDRTHWNYFLAIEQDVINLSRYVEFVPANMTTFSIEIAKILMTSTQEIDVIFKQICKKADEPSENIFHYRDYLVARYPELVKLNVQLPKHSRKLTPFSSWSRNITPSWWKANNDVKHERHIHFKRANLRNLLYSVSALFIVNIYFYCGNRSSVTFKSRPQIFHCKDAGGNTVLTDFGWTGVHYKRPK